MLLSAPSPTSSANCCPSCPRSSTVTSGVSVLVLSMSIRVPPTVGWVSSSPSTASSPASPSADIPKLLIQHNYETVYRIYHSHRPPLHTPYSVRHHPR